MKINFGSGKKKRKNRENLLGEGDMSCRKSHKKIFLRKDNSCDL
jgi:hypothetical protein